MTGLKFDNDKVRMELLAPEALIETAKVLTYGAEKYSARNWEKGIEYSRVYGALQRHLHAWFSGENVDPESNINHLHHAACCVMFLQSYVVRGKKHLDDRPALFIDEILGPVQEDSVLKKNDDEYLAKTVIYIACPLRHDLSDVMRTRINKCNNYARHLAKNGHHIYSPVSHYESVGTISLPTHWHDYWKDRSFVMLSRCDVMHVLMLEGWEVSQGVTAEIQYCFDNNIPVKYVEPQVSWD